MSYQNGANFRICDSLAIASQATVYSNSFQMKFAENFGIWVQAISASSSPTIRIQLEQSAFPPAVENSADANYVVGDGSADVYSNLNDEIAHVKSLSPIPSQYGRYKITGLSGNPADTLLTLVQFQQEMI